MGRSFREVVAVGKAGRYEKPFAGEVWLGIKRQDVGSDGQELQ